MSWRAGATLLRDIGPLIQTHIPEPNFRHEFARDLINFFSDCDMDPTDLRRFDPEIEKILDEIGANEG